MAASQPDIPAQCPPVRPCGELISLREKVGKQERRISTAIDDNSDTARALNTLAERVGVMRPDGTVTAHSLTAAVQQNTNEVLKMRRAFESQQADRPTSDPPRVLDALGDLSEASRIDIERPDIAIKRRRKAVAQRNWMAIGFGIVTFLGGMIEAARMMGWLK